MNTEDLIDARPPLAAALRFGIGLQLILLVVTAPVLDGGQLFRQFAVALIGYWLGVGLIAVRRRAAPSKVDLFLIRYGSLALLILGPVIGKVIYLLIGESTDSGIQRWW
jgi:hypothetical protein